MTNKIENKVQHKKQNKLAAGVAGLISLSFGLTAVYFTSGGLQPDTASAQINHRSNARTAPVVRHELVPHVVLPASIEYKKVAKNGNAADTCFVQSGNGVVSPFVATYTPFPSYQVPATTSFQPAGQSVYPIIEEQSETDETAKSGQTKIPQRLPKQLEQKHLDNMPQAPELQEPAILTNNARKLLKYFDEEPADSSIQLVSNDEEIVPAVPLSPLDSTVEQTGLFCPKPAKPPAAWSFNSPLFKAANVPMGWNNPQFNGSITQVGRFGSSQVGFGPAGQQMGQSVGIQPQGYPINAGGFNGTDSNGVSVQQLPNGMLLMTAPSDHANCGLLRCRCGNQPKMMLLPPAPLGQNPLQNPMQNPAGIVPTGNNGAMMNPFMQQQLMQAALQQQYIQQQYMQQQAVNQQSVQMMPITAMTPYGMTVVGYQAVPVAVNPYLGDYGNVPMNFAQNQGFPSLIPNTGVQNGERSGGNAEGKESGDGELQQPQQLTANGFGGFNAGLVATPYGVYAQQTGASAVNSPDAKTTADGKTNPLIPNTNAAAQNNVNPFGYYPVIMYQQPQYGNSHCGLGFGQNNPSMYYTAPFGYGGAGFGNAGLVNCSAGGFGGGMPFGEADMTANVTRADLMTMMMIMSQQQQQNQQQRRFRLFQRIAERRESRKSNRNGGAAPDLMQQLMQAWSTPYIAPDTAFRMPSRNMYPYGNFGAQPGGVQTANYGGFYNLSAGNTAYPGLY